MRAEAFIALRAGGLIAQTAYRSFRQLLISSNALLRQTAIDIRVCAVLKSVEEVRRGNFGGLEGCVALVTSVHRRAVGGRT